MLDRLGWALKSMTSVPCIRRQTETLQRERHVKTEVEIGEVRLQTREHPGLLAVTGSQERHGGPLLPGDFWAATNPADTDF